MKDVNSTITCDEVEEWSTISKPLLIAERSLICIASLSLPAGVPHFSHSYRCPTEPGVNPNGEHNQFLRWSYNSHVTSFFMLLANPCENVFNKTSDFYVVSPATVQSNYSSLCWRVHMKSHCFAYYLCSSTAVAHTRADHTETANKTSHVLERIWMAGP